MKEKEISEENDKIVAKSERRKGETKTKQGNKRWKIGGIQNQEYKLNG